VSAATGPPAVVVDAAGGVVGGAARWRAELDAYLATADRERVTTIGDGRRLTPAWLLQRERMARAAGLLVAPNNVSFATGRGERRVLLRNALHFLHRSEEHLLTLLPRSFRAQIPVVRRLLPRADLIVVPCSAMADRVVHHVPSAAMRIVVRPHPVSPTGPRRVADVPFILVPVVPGPYKNLIQQLRLLLAAGDPRDPMRIRVTANASDLPGDLACHPRIDLIGIMPADRLAALWRSATAAFYPSCVEAFGYPLAEARAYGVPVIAPNTAQGREIAGGALRGYDPADPQSLRVALSATAAPVASDPTGFARDPYFDWLLGSSTAAVSAPPLSRRPPETAGVGL